MNKVCDQCKVEKDIEQFSFSPKPGGDGHLACCKVCESLFIKCYECGNYKTYAEFSGNKSRKNGKQTYCKQCGKDHQTEWYYRRKHKLTVTERDTMLKDQGGKCMICQEPIAFLDDVGRHGNVGTTAVVDHCHTTQAIRGVLCGYCNVGIGSFRDNTDYLFNAIKYLSSGEF
jgi:hypothetical protein